MNKIEELKFNADALLHAVKEDRKFFASIYNFVEKLNTLLTSKLQDAKKEEIQFLAKKIESFFNNYRSSDAFYIPPHQTSQSNETVKDIFRLSNEIATLPENKFQELKPKTTKSGTTTTSPKKTACVFIGHGRSKIWARLQIFLQNDLQIKTVSYESESRVGESIIPILEEMLDRATYAVLVLTAEDQTNAESKRARQNVIHEAGLFQGRLGFDRAVLLVQRGIEGFTNVDGLQYIPFTDENIEETFYQLQRALKEKGLIST